MIDDRRWTIATASDAIGAGRCTPTDLVEHCLQKIDRHEQQVRAWVSIEASYAREEAERLTAELKKGQCRGPLHGIPIGVKDVFDVFDWPTAAGSKRWESSDARQDADVVAKLRQAGAIFLGKAVTTAYASFDPPVTRNPWNPDRTPGGSSSGSAAAVAMGMCLGATATQTGGSIARPAAYCGVCGLKPTFGRLSVKGVVPLAFSMDHAGAIAGSVIDLAILLQAMADVGGRFVDGFPVPEPDDYVSAVKNGPPCLEIGRFHGLFDQKMDVQMREAMGTACDKLQEAGMMIVDCHLPASFADITARHQQVMAVEAAAFHAPRLKRHPEDYPPRIRSLIEEGIKTGAPEYAATKLHQQALKREILESFRDDVAVIITPAATGPAPVAATTGLPTFNSPWSYTGLPTVNIPIGWSSDGLPLSLQFVGRPWEEAELLQVAAWCENVLGWQPHRAVA